MTCDMAGSLSEHLDQAGNTILPLEERRSPFVAGDDSQAKEVVAHLTEQIGFAPVDTGFLREGGATQQPGTPIYNFDVTKSKALEMLAEGAI